MIRLVSIALAGSLSSAPLAAVPPPLLLSPAVEYDLTESEEATIDALLDAMRSAEDTATEDPTAGFEELMVLLEQIEEDPGLSSKSPHVLEDRCFTALTVADVLVEGGDEANATLLLDYVIRASHNKELPISTYSKRLRKLYEERTEASDLAVLGTVSVQCQEPCRVVLDEQVVGDQRGADVEDLRVGEHRLYVEATTGSTAPVSRLLVVSPEDSDVMIEFGSGDVMEETPPRRRKLPRWAGITGVVIGAAAVIAGATLVALHETCPDGSDPSGPDACDNVFDTFVPGVALAAAGGATLLGFSIALGVGERRHRRAGGANAHIGLNYRIQF